jgi:hypothetical protein
MASRTSTQNTHNLAVKNFEGGTVNFRVLAVGLEVEGGMSYTIAVPKAAMRSGLFREPSNVGLSSWGQRTKFGDDIYRTFGNMKGVEVYLDNDTPHLLIVFIQNDVIREMQTSYISAAQGLPPLICVTLEDVVLRNDSFTQRVAEWLRRLF